MRTGVRGYAQRVTSAARSRVHPTLDRVASYAWRLLVVGAAAYALLWLVGQLLVVVVPVAVAVLITRALAPVASRLRRAGWRPGLAAAATLLAFLVVVGAVLGLVGARLATGFDDVGATVSAGIDDIETWLVEDSPFDVDRSDVRRWREDIGDAANEFWRSSRGSVLSGAVMAAEIAVGLVLCFVVTFFMLKDGDRFHRAALRRLRHDRQDVASRMGERAWAALGGYLRGAALLGLVESVIIAGTLLLVGGDLVAAVAVLTFLGAFVPIVGAITAAIVAVLVALVTAGTTGALVVAIVALLVQQFDNDLLAPVIYGRAVRLHPLTVLLGITAGGALFGLVGTLLAVPVLAVAINAVDEARRDGEGTDGDRRASEVPARTT